MAAVVVVGVGALSTTTALSLRTTPDPTLSPAVHDTSLQSHLREFPRDADGWAELGAVYVQQARVSGDPSFYPKAEGALRRSLTLRPDRNAGAMTGLGALANARHDFATALDWARRARAADPYDATALGVEDDARTQLGDYPGAREAVRRMLRLAPGVPSFARASYHYEETGDVDASRAALEQALEAASQPADIAFCRQYLGELAFSQGDPRGALEQYRQGLTADPGNVPLLAGRARSRAAVGDPAGAERDYADVVARLPSPQYLLEYAELLQSRGRDDLARQQLDLIDAQFRLQAANGVRDDLTASVVAADHGSAADAVRSARAEWSRRRSVLVADALAWALHRAGRDEEARGYAVRADRLGWRNATFSYHRGMIELALGHRAEGRRQLERALRINPYFSAAGAAQARAALR